MVCRILPRHLGLEEVPMTRRIIALLITLTLAILVAPLAAGVLQSPTTVHRIGLLSGRERATMT
jgi:hypothetical protein